MKIISYYCIYKNISTWPFEKYYFIINIDIDVDEACRLVPPSTCYIICVDTL